jgi:hypothetical protein
MNFLCVRARSRRVLNVAGILLASLVLSEQVRAADGLAKQIDDLTKAMTVEAVKDDAVQTSLIALLGQIAKLECTGDQAKKVDCKIAQIAAFATQVKLGTSLTADQYARLRTVWQPLLTLSVDGKDTALLGALDFAKELAKTPPVREPDLVMASLGGVIAQINSAVTTAKPGDNLPWPKLVAMVQTITAAQKDFDKLLVSLPYNVRKDVVGAINILGAWYGDIRSIRGDADLSPWRYNDRFCSATRAVRARCQGKPKCYYPPTPPQTGNPPATSDDGVPSEINGATLCGYEPAPFADPKYRGLVVSYECVALDTETWRIIGRGDPVRKDDYNDPLDAQLRSGATQEIRCQGNAP